MSYNSYRDSSTFLKAVKDNDVFYIKSELEGLIFRLKGDKKKCEEAIEYARNNSDFDWEEDDGVTLTEGSTRDKYNYEKGRLVRNFSKERFEKVVNLYKALYPTENIQVNNQSQKKTTQIGATKKNNYQSQKMDLDDIPTRAKLIAIGVAVVIVIGIIVALV